MATCSGYGAGTPSKSVAAGDQCRTWWVDDLSWKGRRPRSPLLRWVLCARRLRLRALHRDSRDQRRVDSDRAHRCGTTRRTQRSHSARQDLVEKGGVVPQMLVLIVG